MNPFNLGLCVSNSLFKTESTTISSGKQEADVMSSIVEFLILSGSSLFGSDVVTCIADKRIIVHQIGNQGMSYASLSNAKPLTFRVFLVRPAASSIESLDEVESSPHVPVVNRSRDSGLATSDQPFNDDSSEVSEHFRRQVPIVVPKPPDWTASIVCGKGTVLSSIIVPTTNTFAFVRYRNGKPTYKPSKQFLRREKLTHDTTDDSDQDAFKAAAGAGEDSSVRSSTTTVNNMTVGKTKRSKPISRHSSLGSSEYQQQQLLKQALSKESKPIATGDVKRTSSLKQFHHSSDDSDEQKRTLNHFSNMPKKGSTLFKKNEPVPMTTAPANSKLISNERRSRLGKSKSAAVNQNSEDESFTTR